MNARVINTLTKDASKAEEIALIQSLASHIEPGTYLASLFTSELVAWIEDRIKSDWTLDLLLEYQDALRREGNLLNQLDSDRKYYEGRITKLNKEVDRQKSEVERWEQNYQYALQDLKAKDREIEKLQAALERAQAMQPCEI